jgi:hypothetical protein
LIPLLRDPVPAVRGQAAQALARIGEQKFLPLLVAALTTTEDEDTRRTITASLSLYRAIAPLVSAAQSGQVRTRMMAIDALANIASDKYRSGSDIDSARAWLNAAQRRNDFIAGVAALNFYIAQGDKESVPFLISSLRTNGDKEMALVFLNSGMPALEDAARAWATANGYTVEKKRASTSTPRWGSGR